MSAPLPESPARLRRLCDRLETTRENKLSLRAGKQTDRQKLLDYLAIADQVKAALDHFSDQLFSELVSALQIQLTRALQDVLDQPIELKVERDLKAGAVTLGFYVERAGMREDIMKGQGGSVVNVLSVGLRILALAAVEDKLRRKFLVLDEQDCWLRPDLIPRLVQIIRQAGTDMGYQVLMISHHEPSVFAQYADKIYQCHPSADGSGVSVKQVAALRTDALGM